MPDDDWALGQNEVDVRNEARNPLNEMPIARRYHHECAFCGAVYNGQNGMGGCLIAGRHMWKIVNEVFACRNPEQAWIDESRAEAEREEES